MNPLVGTRSFSALAAAVGACVPLCCSPPDTTVSDQDDQAALEAIEALHRTDQRASLAHDAETLLSLWSDDPAALPPRGPIVRGDSLRAWLRSSLEASSPWETVEYVQDWQEVQVIGDYAWDMGTYRGRSRNRETGQEVSSSGKLLRILQRQPDGSWKVHRSIWNQEPAQAGAGGG